MWNAIDGLTDIRVNGKVILNLQTTDTLTNSAVLTDILSTVWERGRSIELRWASSLPLLNYAATLNPDTPVKTYDQKINNGWLCAPFCRFAVHGRQCTWKGEEKDCRNAVQLDCRLPQWDQDKWSLPNTEKTRFALAQFWISIFFFLFLSLFMTNTLPTGLVTRDPELPPDRTLIPSPPTRPKHPVFDNEDMGKVCTFFCFFLECHSGFWTVLVMEWARCSCRARFQQWTCTNFVGCISKRALFVFAWMQCPQLLAELLRSKNPEDLQEANRLIKNMVKEVRHFPSHFT